MLRRLSCTFGLVAAVFRLDDSGRSIELQHFQWQHLHRTIGSEWSSSYEEYLTCFPGDRRIYQSYRAHILKRPEPGRFLTFLKFFPNDPFMIAQYKEHVLQSGERNKCAAFLRHIPGDDADVLACYRAMVLKEDSCLVYKPYCEAYPEDEDVANKWRALVLRNPWMDKWGTDKKCCQDFLAIFPDDKAVQDKLAQILLREMEFNN